VPAGRPALRALRPRAGLHAFAVRVVGDYERALDTLAQRARELWLIEVDRDLASRLVSRYARQPHVHIVDADGNHLPTGQTGEIAVAAATRLLRSSMRQAPTWRSQPTWAETARMKATPSRWMARVTFM